MLDDQIFEFKRSGLTQKLFLARIALMRLHSSGVFKTLDTPHVQYLLQLFLGASTFFSETPLAQSDSKSRIHQFLHQNSGQFSLVHDVCDFFTQIPETARSAAANDTKMVRFFFHPLFVMSSRRECNLMLIVELMISASHS